MILNLTNYAFGKFLLDLIAVTKLVIVISH